MRTLTRKSELAAGLVFLATIAIFLPAVKNAFVDWDDGVYILSNPHIRGLSWPNLRWMLTTFDIGHYIPVTWLSFALDYSLWGLSPRGFHATNVLLHGLNAIWVFWIGERLLAAAMPEADRGSILLGAGFGALVFSLHPLRVESVAWAFERKDVLCGFFYLGAVWAYLRERRFLSLALFALSLLSKAMGVALPLVLVILDLYPMRKPLSMKILIDKVPYAVMAASAALVTYVGHERL